MSDESWWDDLSIYDTGPSNPGGASVLTPDPQFAGGESTPSGSSASYVAGITNPGAEDLALGTSGDDKRYGPVNVNNDSGGWTDRLAKWALANKEVAGALATAIFGAIGGAGTAAVNRGTMERKAELELQNQQQLNSDKTTRAAANAFKGNLAMQPSGNQVIKRAGGAPVYDPVSGQVRRPGIIGGMG